jgi:hypothetical protein
MLGMAQADGGQGPPNNGNDGIKNGRLAAAVQIAARLPGCFGGAL